MSTRMYLRYFYGFQTEIVNSDIAHLRLHIILKLHEETLANGSRLGRNLYNRCIP